MQPARGRASSQTTTRRTTPTLEEQPEETREARNAASGGSSTTPTTRRATSTRPLGELTGFRTFKGVVLLYEPNPLDAWIGKQVQQQPGGTYAYTESGEALTKKEVKQYKAFCRRHSERGEEARLADKLFHIVDKHLPLQADETRAYIARFPGEARKLLPKARKIRNTFRRQGGLRTTTECQPTVQEGEESPQAADVSAYAMPAPSMPGEAMTAERVRRENLEEDAAREKKEQPVDSDTPPDWGGDTDDEGPPPNWPWGERGRPSDLGLSAGVLADRPNEPSGVPRHQQGEPGGEDRGIQLVPSRTWQDVMRVQAHMEQARKQRHTTQ